MGPSYPQPETMQTTKYQLYLCPALHRFVESGYQPHPITYPDYGHDVLYIQANCLDEANF